MENIRQKIVEIITHTHKTPLEQADEILLLFSVVGRSEQLESGLTCMMCRKPKHNDGHTCCEECAGLAF